MNKRRLGRVGIEVSEIAFGGVEIGMPYGIGVSSQANMPGENEAVELLVAAVDNGINFFDTSRLYGKSEEIMGRAFKSMRDRVVICTKSEVNFPVTSKTIKETLATNLKQSLVNLQTDYVDVYLAHNATAKDIQNPELVEAFADLKKQGLIRACGASTYGVAAPMAAIKSGNWDVIQLAYNLLDQTNAESLSLAKEHNIGIMVRSVLFKGILTDKGRGMNSQLNAVEEHVKLYEQFFGPQIQTMSDLATKFVLSHEEVSSALVGIDRMEYLHKALKTADGNYLDENTLNRAKKLAYPDPDFLDLSKWTKQGWLS